MKTSAGIRLVPVLLAMGTIFFLSHQPGSDLRLLDIPGLDKLAHAIAYGILAATVLFALPGRFSRSQPGRACLLVILFTVGYGLTDEYHQSFIPGREASLADIAADAAGAAATVLLWARWRLTRKERDSAQEYSDRG